MDIALVAARILLAAVFGLSGVAKLIDADGSRQGMADFGVPATLAGLLGRVLPLVELAVAVALLPVGTAWWGALGSLALLLLFLAGIGLSLARGRRPACRCFGQLSSEPIGTPTIVRNVVLAGLAAFVLVPGPGRSGASTVAWLGNLSTAERAGVLLGTLVVLALGGIAWLLLQVLRQQGRLLLRLDGVEAQLDGRFVGNGTEHHQHVPATAGSNGHAEAPTQGLPIGAPAPEVTLPDLDGDTWSLDRLLAPGKPALLLFVDPGCGPCKSLLPDVAVWQRDHRDTFTVALVSRGSVDENRRKIAAGSIGPLLLQEEFEVADVYQAPGTPAAVVVGADGSIASAVAAGPDAIRTLVARTVGGGLAPDHHAHAQRPEPGLPLGSPAPEIELADLDGITLRLDDLRGRKTLLLFWNPGCGFCQQLLPDLKAWEDEPPPRAPELVLVAGGPAETNRALGLRSTILLDPTGATAQAYQAGGTPMAVLIDGEGRIASTLVAGAPGVLALAGGRPRDCPLGRGQGAETWPTAAGSTI